MRDNYFYKSLFSTLLVYTIILFLLVTFVLVTGAIGVFFVLATITVLFIFFYDGFKIIKNRRSIRQH